jgi:hypothetical protein
MIIVDSQLDLVSLLSFEGFKKDEIFNVLDHVIVDMLELLSAC